MDSDKIGILFVRGGKNKFAEQKIHAGRKVVILKICNKDISVAGCPGAISETVHRPGTTTSPDDFPRLTRYVSEIRPFLKGFQPWSRIQGLA